MFITGSRYSFPSETHLLDANLLEGMSWKQNNILSNSASIEIPTFGDIEQCFSNTITTTTAYAQYDENFEFLLANNVFKGETTYRDNSFGHGFRNNTFNTSCDSNRIGGDFYNNIINDDFDNNIINDNFYDNIINCDFQRNTINGEFYNNHFGDDEGEDFDYNLIHASFYNNFYTGDDNFEYNLIKGSFYQNIIRDEFSKNTLNGFYNNVLNSTFSDNQVGEGFYGNKTYQEFSENTIADEVYNNNFFSSFLGNTLRGNEVYNNNFYSYTEDNQIGSYFHSNDIGEPDDHGDTNFRRNKIDSWFYYNVILGNMQNNTIANYFYENTIGNNFQFNEIKTSLDGYDFTQYYGNLTGVSFPNDVAGTDGTYNNVIGTTSGIGVNAEFGIIVTGNLVTTVNTTNGGKLYKPNDTITIPSSSFGGTADLVLTEDGLSLVPEVYKDYNKTIQKAGDGTNVLTVILPGEGYYPFITANITEAID
jgi:hypothetical protein